MWTKLSAKASQIEFHHSWVTRICDLFDQEIYSTIIMRKLKLKGCKTETLHDDSEYLSVFLKLYWIQNYSLFTSWEEGVVIYACYLEWTTKYAINTNI